MIEIIDDLPAKVLGLRASGHVSAQEYESVVVPAVEAKFALMAQLRLLYVLDEDLEGFGGGAMWDSLQLRLRHLGGWEKIALVTDIEWLGTAVRIFGVAMSGEARVFSHQQLAEAQAWVIE